MTISLSGDQQTPPEYIWIAANGAPHPVSKMSGAHLVNARTLVARHLDNMESALAGMGGEHGTPMGADLDIEAAETAIAAFSAELKRRMQL
jgi:hypothetical protein